jgi:hypothetical protein
MKSLTELFAAMDTDPRETSNGKFVADAAFTTPQEAFNFLLGGKATLTFRSKKTGNRFTFLVEASDDERVYFVKMLVGSNNESDYQYLGHIFARDRKYVHGKKSRITADAPGAKAFNWVYCQLLDQKLPDTLEVWHEGVCGRCGRKLTVPESIRSGFGPECITKRKAHF